MTPQEKAIQLIEKLLPHVYNEYDGGKEFNAKRHTIQCALIAVDMVIENLSYDPSTGGKGDEFYWLDVKKELQKL